MSVEAITWALNLAPVPRDKSGQPNTACAFVLIGLANHADPDGTGAFPSARTLARYARLSVRHVRTALDRLEAAGIIRPCDPAIIAARIRRGDRRPQGWDLDTSLIRDDLTEEDATDLERLFPGLRQRIAASSAQTAVPDGVNWLHPVRPTPPGPVDNSGHGVNSVHPVTPNGVKPVPQRGEASSPEPSLNRPFKTPSGGRDAPATDAGDDNRDRNARGGVSPGAVSPPVSLSVSSAVTLRVSPPVTPGVSSAVTPGVSLDGGAGKQAGGEGQADGGPRASARKLIAGYVARCPARPPSAVLSQLGKHAAVMLAEGIDPAAIARALERFADKPMSPSVLPSLVNEELNPPRTDGRPAPPVDVAMAVPDADPDNPAAYLAALRRGAYRAATPPAGSGPEAAQPHAQEGNHP